MTLLINQPHRRYNPLKDEWILISPHRTKRPWQGKEEEAVTEEKPVYDPQCYLCPGNIRANGQKNPSYTNTYVFPNDFQALLSNASTGIQKESDIFQVETVQGECRVLCFSPKHNVTLSQMSVDEINTVITLWIDQINELIPHYKWIQIFENKGSMMGASNPHPHGQIWASNFIPQEIQKEDSAQRQYFQKHHSQLLVDYVSEELRKQERVVASNDSWVVLVPFWAVWPYEVIVLPRAPRPHFLSISEEEQHDLATITKTLLTAYDRLFNTSMPYSMGWHFAPLHGQDDEYWQLHAHFYPPLLRSATVKKFMVGYEMLAETQRDITAEMAAQTLRELSES